MARFYYKAIAKNGQMKSGSLSGASRAAVKRQLLRMRLKPLVIKVDDTDLDVKETEIFGDFIYRDGNGNIQISLWGNRPTAKHIIVFTKQLATMIGSGVPLIQAIGILSEQQDSRVFMKILKMVKRDIENGVKLSSALANHKGVFDSLYIALIRAGEASGNLDGILQKLTEYIEKAEKIRSQVKSAMAYPLIIVGVAIAVLTLLMVYLVPVFVEQYSQNRAELPQMTQIVIFISDLLIDKWDFFVGIFVASILSFRIWISTKSGRKSFDQFLLKAPGIGLLMTKIAVGRFCSTMATMLSSGVNVLEALTICSTTSGNKVLEEFILKVRFALEHGAKLSEPLKLGGLFPQMVTSMVAVGEETGSLDAMLAKVSLFYEEEVELAIQTMMSMIEPILIVIIGGIVGVIAVSLYLPLFDLPGLIAP